MSDYVMDRICKVLEEERINASIFATITFGTLSAKKEIVRGKMAKLPRKIQKEILLVRQVSASKVPYLAF